MTSIPLPTDPVEEYERLLKSNYKESDFQKFLENNPLFIPQTQLLNHRLHLESFISQFPLDTALKTDFVYITKSSVKWEIVLVEIERPDKEIFTNDHDQITQTAEFTRAQAQIFAWEDFIERNGKEVIRRLEPLLVPAHMRTNRISFRTMLIIGRSHQLERNQAMKDRWASFSTSNRHFHTFDSLLNHYKNQISRPNRPTTPNIISLSKNRYHFKYMHHNPFSLFSLIGPGDFFLSSEQRSALIADGYEIDTWEKGELLVVNGKTMNVTI